MKRGALTTTIQVLALSSLVASARAADYYVAAVGDDKNAGSLEQPFRTIERAQQAASPGDTVYIRGGLYEFRGTANAVGVSFTKSGAADRPIRYFAYRDEVPVFDLAELTPQQRITGLDVRCNWIHIRGLEVRRVRQLIVGDSWGVRVRGDHNVIERLNVHHNEAPGIFITSGRSNLILNCDSHHNYDPLEQGGNADGFGCHASGGDNVMRGCRAWENSDDGYDFINAAGTCIAESSWAFRNGYIPDTNTAAANGAGFKSGGYGVPPNVPASGAPRHVVRKSLAFANRAIGFYANYHTGGLDFFNNTAFDNPANYDMRTTGSYVPTHKLRNNVSAGSGRALVNWSGGSDEFNSWNLPVQAGAADFASLDRALALMPRAADGSLPASPLARLARGSDLIDRGQDVGLPYSGAAPDLGAYEWGESTPPASDAGAAIEPSVDAGSGARADAGQAEAPAVLDASIRPRDAALEGARDASSTVIADAAVAEKPSSETPDPEEDGPEDESPERRASDGCSLQLWRSPPPIWIVLLLAALARRAWRRRARVGSTELRLSSTR